MPKAWSDKDERQYEHVKSEQSSRGKSTREAKAIAARTVNKQRRQEKRTTNTTSQGTGNPNTPLANRSRKELYNRATELNISGRSRMRKQELVNAIRKQQS